MFVMLFCGALLLYSVAVEPYWIAVNHLEMAVPQGADALRGRTAVHLSDLHITAIGAREERLLKIVSAVDPDMIFLTGDYMPWRGDAAPAIAFLGRLRARVGVWAVMGDYDYSDGRQSCLFCHAPNSSDPATDHAVRFLRNAAASMAMDGKAVPIAGFDGEAFPMIDGAIAWSLARADGIAPAIVLSHSPLVLDEMDGTADILVLAGDTHGGQLPLPRWVWRWVGYEKNARYNNGWFQKGRTRMYVNRGIGTSHLPIRLWRRPEVVVLHFH